MLASLLHRHPQARGILVDLPGTVARAAEVIESFGVAGRTAVRGQSFFDPLPAGADLYLLKHVLNDWPDEPTVAILRRCAEAAHPDASIAILGGVSADDAPRSLGIDMLVAGGKTSTLTQFTELARRAGLDVTAARTQSSGRFVVECRPAARAPSLARGQVCYLQLPAADRNRAAAFYQAVFGWDTGTHHPDFSSPGLIGQWVEGRPPSRDAGPVIWLAVADMNETLAKVTAHGGEVLEKPAPDGPTRTLATILDPEGNPVGLAAHMPQPQ
jgi:predicted enzyme related to lactoylglutathione lyase